MYRRGRTAVLEGRERMVLRGKGCVPWTWGPGDGFAESCQGVAELLTDPVTGGQSWKGLRMQTRLLEKTKGRPCS